MHNRVHCMAGCGWTGFCTFPSVIFAHAKSEGEPGSEVTNKLSRTHCIYRVYANRTHDPITARKFNSRNCLYSIRTEATVCNYFL